MATPIGWNTSELWQYLKNLKINISVARKFPEQVKQIDNLLANDKTGMVSTIYDFMVHSATVPMKIETKNDTLNNFLQNWQKRILNRNVNIDIPAGLRELSTQNYMERWRSSMLALKVIWGEERFENQKPWIVPKKMWFLNGGAIITESNGALNTRKFSVKNGKKIITLNNTKTESIYIRKPFTSWHEDTVVPYLVQKGTIFNALMKNAITQKQADVIDAIMPILLQLKMGNDKLAMIAMNPSEEDFKNLKDKIVDAKEKFETSGSFGDIIASLRHDVNLDYLIPDLSKILDEGIVRSTDKNLLSSLGMIELQGFSSTRQEAILNPKVLIEEVTDGVMDWANLLEDVMIDMMDRNKVNHPNLTNNEIRVIPGNIKAFITDDMRSMLRSLYDRGIVSKQSASEEIGNLDFDVQVERREKETENGLNDIMVPPIIQTLDQKNETKEVEDEDKKPGTPEGDNFNQAIVDAYLGKKDKNVAPYENIDVLPENIKNSLPVPAQLIWLNTFNSALDETGDAEQTVKMAWTKVKDKYEKVDDNKKWVKKAQLEDYEKTMSAYTYKYFKDLYETAIENTGSTQNALKTALTIVERVCTKNSKGILVKDKTITKSQMQSLENSDFVEKILDLELKDKKLRLLDKLLENE